MNKILTCVSPFLWSPGMSLWLGAIEQKTEWYWYRWSLPMRQIKTSPVWHLPASRQLCSPQTSTRGLDCQDSGWWSLKRRSGSAFTFINDNSVVSDDKCGCLRSLLTPWVPLAIKHGEGLAGISQTYSTVSRAACRQRSSHTWQYMAWLPARHHNVIL